MENENLETLDSLNPENENADSSNGESDNGEPDLEVLKQQTVELTDKNRKLFARAKDGEEAKKFLKEQGFERKDNKWLKPEPPKPLEKPSNEPDERLDKLTLKSEGITHSDDIKLVLDEAKRLKLPVDEVANMEHIKSKLTSAKEQREAEAGMPAGSGKSSGGSKNTVEYWKDRKDKDGNYETPSDPKLANEVIDARIKGHQDNKMFDDI